MPRITYILGRRMALTFRHALLALCFTFATLTTFADVATPGPLGQHCTFAYQNRFYVLGGMNNKQASSALYYIEAPFSISDPNWILQPLVNPQTVVGPACSVTSSGMLLVTGGHYDTTQDSGLLSLDLTLENSEWFVPEISNPDASKDLISRTSHEQLTYKTSQGDEVLFVYGGNIWASNYMFHIGNMTWEVINMEDRENAPLVDSQFAMFASKDNVYIVGGVNGDNNVTDPKIRAYNLIQKSWFDAGVQLPTPLVNGHAALLKDTVYFISDQLNSESTQALTWHLPSGSWTTLNNVGGVNDSTYDSYQSSQMVGSDTLIMYGGYSDNIAKFVPQFGAFNLTQKTMTQDVALVTNNVPDQFAGGPLAPNQVDPFLFPQQHENTPPPRDHRPAHSGSRSTAAVIIISVIVALIIVVGVIAIERERRPKKKGEKDVDVLLQYRDVSEMGTLYAASEVNSLHKKSISKEGFPPPEHPSQAHLADSNENTVDPVPPVCPPNNLSGEEGRLPDYPLSVHLGLGNLYDKTSDDVSSAYPSSVNIDRQLLMDSVGLHQLRQSMVNPSSASASDGAVSPRESTVALTTQQPTNADTQSEAESRSSHQQQQSDFDESNIKRITHDEPAVADLAPSAPTGTTIFARYELTGTFAVIGKNAVRRAVDWTLNETVAIKYFKCRKSYEREVLMLNHLRSRYIAELRAVYEISLASECPYITVMTYYPQTLQEVINNQLANMDELYLKLIVKAIANALHFLHSQDVAHLDLKPENIARDFGDIASWRLIDFETARFVGEEGVEHCTPCYSSPEVLFAALTKSPVKTATSMDVWSFGAIIFELYSQTPLFTETHAAMDNLTEAYQRGHFDFTAYTVTNNQVLDVLNKMLLVDSTNRATIADILREPLLNSSNAYATLRSDNTHQKGITPNDSRQTTQSIRGSSNPSESATTIQTSLADITNIMLSQMDAVVYSIMDAQGAEVPRLCVLLPGDNSTSIFEPATWNENTFLLHLLCEGLGSGCNNAHFTECKGYQIPDPTPLLCKAGPYMSIVAGVVVLQMQMTPAVLESISLFAASPTDYFSQIAGAFDEVLTSDKTYAHDAEHVRRDPAAYARNAQETAQKAILEFLSLQDPKNSHSGLTYIAMRDGRLRWLCKTCAAQADTTAATQADTVIIPAGGADEAQTGITTKLSGNSEAAQAEHRAGRTTLDIWI